MQHTGTISGQIQLKNQEDSFMKKLVWGMVVLSLLLFSATGLHARGIGVYGGWVFMQDDYEDKYVYDYDDTYTIGIIFDMGSFLFNRLIFRPALDYVNCESDNDNVMDKEIYGIHLDWYWHFMGTGSFSPFLGFGATLNYYEYEKVHGGDDVEDSDAGAEVFAGFNLDMTSSVTLMVQARYAWNDIASRDENMAKVLAGVIFKF
jgi:opacity protein-like surface antigen